MKSTVRPQTASPAPAKPRVWIPALAFVVALLAIGATGFLLFKQHARKMESTAHANLAAIVDLKVERIVQWLDERRIDAEVISGDDLLANQIERWFRQGAPDGVMQQQILARLESLSRIHHYAGIVLLDAQARPRLRVGGGLQFESHDTNLALQTMRKKEATRSGIHWSDDQKPEMDIVAHLAVSSTQGSRVIGAVISHIDPNAFLFPYIQSWSTPSPSAESFLVRREGNEVLFLNELRHRKGTALRLRLPIDDPLLPAAMALRGEARVAEGKDYRGIPVVAVARAVPGTDWILLAKLDRAEVQASIRELQRNAAGLAALFILLSAAVAVLWWRKENARYLGALAEEKFQRLAMEQRFDYATKYARDIVALLDEAGRILDCNDAALAAYGYTREEFLRLDIYAVRAPEAGASAKADLERAAQGAGITFETAHRRKDGSSFPVEVSTRSIEIDGRRFFHVVTRDITERKRAEERLQRLSRARIVMSDCNHVLIHAMDEMQMLQDMCRIVVEVGSYPLVWIGFAEHDADCSVRLVTSAGAEPLNFKSTQVSWADNEHGCCAVGTAIRTGKTSVMQDALTDPAFALWREEAIQHGFRSMLAMPLKVGDACIGALCLQAREVNAFDSAEIELLEELAGDIGFGIGALRKRAEHEAAEQSLRESEARFRSLTEMSSDWYWEQDENFRFTMVSPGFAKAGDFDEKALLGKTRWDANIRSEPGHDLAAHQRMLAAHLPFLDFEYSAVIKGSLVYFSASGIPLFDDRGRFTGYRGVGSNITERKRHEEELERQANFDALTGLPNRGLGRDRIKQAMAHAARAGRLVAVMFLDLDRFKLINDSLGHSTGDAVLLAVAARLGGSLRQGDTVARPGGDEFMIVLADMDKPDDASRVAEKLLKDLSEAILIEGREFRVSASLGISIYPADSDDADILVRNADSAMYQAKELGRNRFQFYTPEMNTRALEKLTLEASLRKALEREEFLLHYQPKVDLRSGRITGVEALLRWQHPDGGLVAPGAFIPVLEETGLIKEAGEWILRTACAQARAWQAAGLPAVRMAVNLSARQLADPQLVAVVLQILKACSLDPDLLELEITESFLMSNPEEAKKTLDELKSAGIHLSVDDFGTGYSSLGYLKRFPLDVLKIDRTFVNEITFDPDDLAIVRGVISLAHNLKLQVIAEGVETRAQLNMLARERCEEIQGYFFSKPLPAAACAALMQEPRTLALPGQTDKEASPALLLVDDAKEALALIMRMLRGEDYPIRAVSSAEEAFELLALEPIAVVLSDYRMPGMDGAEFLRRVKELHPHIVRILMSGDTAAEGSLARAASDGTVFKSFTKPGSAEQLKTSLKEAFGYHQQLQENERLAREIFAAREALIR